jgi:hypothetical protein
MANCTGRFPDAGRAKLASLLKNTDQYPEIYIAWGNGTDALSVTDTGLGFEVSRKRGTVLRTDADTYTVSGSFTVESNGTFSEMGLFDASTGGILLYRGGYSTDNPVGAYDVESLTIAAGDVLDLTIDLSVRGTNLSVTTMGLQKSTDILCAKLDPHISTLGRISLTESVSALVS